jgi:hypothetical protein
MSIRMPLAQTRQLRRLLHTLTGGLGLPPLAPRLEQRLLQAARGRPGWIVKCAQLARQARYWCEHGLLVSALCVDTEAAVRYRVAVVDYSAGSAHSPTDGGSEASGLITPKQAGV